MRAIAEEEESTGDEPEDIPAREMLADLLLETKHPEQALAEYETDLKFNPNRFNGLYGAASAAEQAGKNEKASAYYAQLVKSCDGSNSDRPELGTSKGAAGTELAVWGGGPPLARLGWVVLEVLDPARSPHFRIDPRPTRLRLNPPFGLGAS